MCNTKLEITSTVANCSSDDSDGSADEPAGVQLEKSWSLAKVLSSDQKDFIIKYDNNKEFLKTTNTVDTQQRHEMKIIDIFDNAVYIIPLLIKHQLILKEYINCFETLNLREMDIDNSDDYEVFLNTLIDNTTLKTLDLSKNKLATTHLELFTCILNSTKLENLTFKHNELDDNGAFVLSQLFSSNKTLISVNLSYNKITDVGAEKLAENSTLKTLVLTKNKIGNVGAKAFLDNSSLQSLCLVLNDKITDSEVINELRLKFSENCV